MAIDTTYGGTPIYARFDDVLEASYENSPRTRKVRVYMKPDNPAVLVIASLRNVRNGENAPARLTVEQARLLRDCIDEFLADQDRPASDFARRPDGHGGLLGL